MPPLISKESVVKTTDPQDNNDVKVVDMPAPATEGGGQETTPLLAKDEPSTDGFLQELFSPSVLVGGLSALCACLYTTGAKMATDQAISRGSHILVAFLLVLRSIVGVSICSYEAFQVEGQSFPPGTPEQRPLMITAGVMTMLGIASGLYATAMWGNASVSCIVNTSPGITVLMASLVFCWPDIQEPMNLASAGMLVIAITGIVFVTRPEFLFGGASASDVGLLPPLAAIAQALTQSITNLMIRKIPGKPSAATVTFYVQASMLLFGLCLTLYQVYGDGQPLSVNWDSPAGPLIGMIVVALAGTGANYFKNKALRMSKSVLVVGIRFSTPVLCYGTNAILAAVYTTYTVQSDGYSYVGCALIIVAGVMLLVLKKQKEAAMKKKEEEEKALLEPVVGESKDTTEEIVKTSPLVKASI